MHATVFERWGADTRWPINDVSLFDVHFAGAGVFKAAIAKLLLQRKYELRGRDTNWFRVLRIAIDGPEFYRVDKVPDLLIRRKLIDRLWDRVRHVLEDEISIGNEIYRDDGCVCYLIPFLKPAQADARLQRGVLAEVRRAWHTSVEDEAPTEGVDEAADELTPSVYPHPEPDNTGMTTGALLGKELPPQELNVAKLQSLWAKQAAICSVCGVRPIGDERKERERKVCSVCERRREDRSQEWATKKLSTTIWIDEVADENGRLALVAARLTLGDWLRRHGYI